MCLESVFIFHFANFLSLFLWNWQERDSLNAAANSQASITPLKDEEQEGVLSERPSLMDPWTATSQLPFPRSHGDTSQMTDGSVQAVFTVRLSGDYTKCFFFFFLPVLWSLLCPGRRTENPFVMLNCKEHAFSHSTGSFCKNVLSGHHVGPENPAVLLGRQMPWKNYIA